MHVVTDTHPWVWFLTGNSRLSPKANAALADSSNLIIIPSIVMMEIRYLYQHKRITRSSRSARGTGKISLRHRYMGTSKRPLLRIPDRQENSAL